MTETKRVFMTGGTSGLGKEAACKLASEGYDIFILSRSKSNRTAFLDYYYSNFPKGSGILEFLDGDLSDLNSLDSMFLSIKERELKFDILILNAGIMNFKYVETKQKLEETFQVNLLAPYYIFNQLLSSLGESPKVIFTASALHKGEISYTNRDIKKSFSALKEYSSSKLGIILLTRYLSRKHNNISFYSQHPGVVRTDLDRNANFLVKLFFKIIGISPAKGAQTLLHLVNTNPMQLISGEYYAKSKLASASKESNNLESAKKLIAYLDSQLKYIPVE